MFYNSAKDGARYGSMPQSAIAEGIVDFILSPQENGL